jgi:uncharacterized membrane protein
MKAALWVAMICSMFMLMACDYYHLTNQEAVGWAITFSISIGSLLIFVLEEYENHRRGVHKKVNRNY